MRSPPHRSRPTRSRPRAPKHLLTSVLLLVTSVAAANAHALAPAHGPTARAERADEAVLLGRIPGLPLWLLDAAVANAGVRAAAVLAIDGTVWWVSEGRTVRLATGMRAEQATSCGGALFAVDGLARLRRFARAPGDPIALDSGPEVSLLHRPACLDALPRGSDREGLSHGAVAVVAPFGDVVILERDLRVRSAALGVRALPDAEPTVVDLGGGAVALAVLTEPTLRYRHGVLGDEVEAGAVVLLALPSLEVLGRWAPPAPAVIEERRSVAWAAHGEAGIHLTVSDDVGGARIVTLAWRAGALVRVAEGPDLGGASRWLHVIAAVDDRVYAQHRPHVRGPLVRYDLSVTPQDSARADAATGVLEPSVVATDLDVVSHVVGERNLDRALWLRTLAPGVDALALPYGDGGGVRWIRCDAFTCRTVHSTAIGGPLATNLALVGPSGAPEGLLAADVDGSVWWLPIPAAWER